MNKTFIRAVYALVAGIAVAATPIPSKPAHAGSRDAAIAAGVIGVIGTAIIMQNQFKKPPPAAKKKVRAKPKQDSEQAASKKDPFAASAAPAGYATPVSNK